MFHFKKKSDTPGILSSMLKYAWLLLFLNCSCGRQHPEHLFTLLSPGKTHAGFSNDLDYETQLKNKFNIYTFRNFYNGAGVALGDINNDGLIDIFMASNMGTNVLYLNKGDFVFEDISKKAGIQGKGWSTGVSFADVNGDGWLDLYVCKTGESGTGIKAVNEFYINRHDLTFNDEAASYGINESGNSTQGVFFDYDKDGDLDLYLLKNSPQAIGSFSLDGKQRFVRDTLIGGDKFFRNDGNKFTDVSEQAGIYGSAIGFGLGVTVGDIDQDGWMDIYVSNDFFERDYIYLNNHDGTFRETLTSMMPSISAASMGADMADINNDHFPEIFATDMIPGHHERLKTKTTFDSWESYQTNIKGGFHKQFSRNMLQLNNGDGTFSEIGRMTGICATDWSWGSLILDMNNDGFKDIFVANGIYKDLTDQDYIQYFSNRDRVMSIISGKDVNYRTLIDAIPSVKIPSYAFENMGPYNFRDVTSEWGLETPSFSNGSAYGDLDNDGDFDLVINNVNMPMFIYRNESDERLPQNHYLKVILKGEPPNTEAIGTKITALKGTKMVYVEQMPMRGYLSTSDSRPNLGLGEWAELDSLVVQWPDERVTVLTHVKTDQALTLSQKDGRLVRINLADTVSNANALMKETATNERIDFIHREDEYNDFKNDHLLYHMMSTEGPRFCQGDVNGDGLQDIFICGARGQADALLLQQRNGKFTETEKNLFEKDRISEDVDCALFDADGDGDPDLYVASGGNEFPESSSALNDRLYFNDGRGKFSKSSQILPVGKYENSSCVRAADFDNDGITELFVGIRLKPFAYGVPVNGYLLENDGKGHLSDVTSSIAPGLQHAGMIHDMQWADTDGDGDKDIVLAGDWMAIKIFINNNGKFAELTNPFGNERTEGWWNCVKTADLDGDGDMDIIAGNHGLNSMFKASPEKPVSMVVNDFDFNGTIEQIISSYDGDKSYPLALKHDLVNQVPSLAAKYPKYEDYKDQQVTDIFSPVQLKSAIHLQAYLLETSVFINDGDGHFNRKPLPPEAQLAPVYAILTGDYNNDGKTDILLGGNLYSAKPEIGRYDASYGTFLAGDGKGDFTAIPAKKSGFRLFGEIRDMQEVTTPAGKILVVTRSNNGVQVFIPGKN